MSILRQQFLQYVAQTSTAPMLLNITKAEGVYLFDTDGKKYIDLISGIGVSSFGHGNPKIIKAIQQQTEKYLHLMVYGEYVQQPQVALAEKMCSHLPNTLNSVYYVNSGSEAIEGAIKLAKRATGKSKIIAAKNAYHGSTHGALSLMDNEYFTQAYRPLLPQIEFIDYNTEEDLEKITNSVAAVVIETIQGEAGYLPPNSNYLKKLKAKCQSTGTLLILDEIQCGMGRTGSLFAFEQYGIAPDILVLAKAFGAGMPLGAFIADKSLMQLFTDNPVLGHITTFGGHPVSCAAALAGLQWLEETEVYKEVHEKEKIFRAKLNGQDISGKGLMLSVNLKSEPRNKKIISKCIENGLITDWFLHCDYKLRIAPPLIISENEIETACEIILNAIESVDKEDLA
jgi:acetylornithine/succinyldiaminopimelate/putrescine aminotransferase